MTLPQDVVRCLGQHISGDECLRKKACERHTELKSRAAGTHVFWWMCHEGGDYPSQIKVEGGTP